MRFPNEQTLPQISIVGSCVPRSAWRLGRDWSRRVGISNPQPVGTFSIATCARDWRRSCHRERCAVPEISSSRLSPFCPPRYLASSERYPGVQSRTLAEFQSAERCGFADCADPERKPTASCVVVRIPQDSVPPVRRPLGLIALGIVTVRGFLPRRS